MEIVAGTLDDARAVAEIHVNAWQVAYRDLLSADFLARQSVDQREARWREIISAGRSDLLVAKDNGKTVGWINFGACRDEGAPGTEAEIWALYVAPQSWSGGAGRALWLEAKTRLVARKFETCSLWVFPQNERAIRFYTKAGFVPDASMAKDFELGGAKLQEARYACRLAE